MDSIHIEGGTRLHGVIPVSGAKNAALPLMIVSLLTDGVVELDNVPRVVDVRVLSQLLLALGVEVTSAARNGGSVMRLQARRITATHAPYALVSRMRASFWVIGPLLARAGRARVPLPGGCAIGTRPVDLSLGGLEAMGATVRLEGGDVCARAPRQGLHGAVIRFPLASVGATQTLMMAATLARGETVLENAAREPEVADVARCLVRMGAQVEGIGSATLVVRGADALSGTQHVVAPDRIEAGTYALAVAIAGGEVELAGVRACLLPTVLDCLRRAGVEVAESAAGLRVARGAGPVRPVSIATGPYPGFPTDLQAQWMALMSIARGRAEIVETIFENRFMHVQELNRLGADISLHGDTASVRGVDALRGAPVMATDLRASVSLVIAGLAAAGETVISRVYHLDRGFEALEHKLAACGARIRRVRGGRALRGATAPSPALLDEEHHG